MRWVTPLGWFEELAPPAAPRLPTLALSLGVLTLVRRARCVGCVCHGRTEA